MQLPKSPTSTPSSDSEAEKVVFKGRTVVTRELPLPTGKPFQSAHLPTFPRGIPNPTERFATPGKYPVDPNSIAPTTSTTSNNVQPNVRPTQQQSAQSIRPQGHDSAESLARQISTSTVPRQLTSVPPHPALSLPHSRPKDQPAHHQTTGVHTDNWGPVSKWSVQLEPADTPFVPDTRLSKTEKRRLKALEDSAKNKENGEPEWEDLERNFGSGKNEGERAWEELERRENGRYKFGRKVLEKQGWKKGEGLGRDGEGRREVVDVKGKEGRDDRGGLGS
ncbi:putative G-patch domain-containing protein [Septoria linicola]|nr:putative G-patch domain-containing protein [Septoria linicola]